MYPTTHNESLSGQETVCDKSGVENHVACKRLHKYKRRNESKAGKVGYIWAKEHQSIDFSFSKSTTTTTTTIAKVDGANERKKSSLMENAQEIEWQSERVVCVMSSHMHTK